MSDLKAPYFRRIPGSRCFFPKDHQSLHKTEDLLFLAMLLKRSEPAQQIIEVLDAKGMRQFLPELKVDAVLFAAKGIRIRSRINRSTIRRIFSEKFYGFRRAISSGTLLRNEFMLGEQVVKPSNSQGNKGLWNFGSKLTHPFSKEGDPLLAELHKIRFFSWEMTAATKDTLYCPVDGPVNPIEAMMKTAAESWRLRCGRQWSFLLCPHCLGVFATKITRRN